VKLWSGKGWEPIHHGPEVRPASNGRCPCAPLPRAARVGLPPHRLWMSPVRLAWQGHWGVFWRPPSGGSPTRRRLGIRPLGNPWLQFAPRQKGADTPFTLGAGGLPFFGGAPPTLVSSRASGQGDRHCVGGVAGVSVPEALTLLCNGSHSPVLKHGPRSLTYVRALW
jgi:hypothetical protein